MVEDFLTGHALNGSGECRGTRVQANDKGPCSDSS